MSLSKMDLQQVRRAMRTQGVEYLEFNLGAGRLVLRKNPVAAPAASPSAASEPVPAATPAELEQEKTTVTVRATTVGRLRWTGGVAPRTGAHVGEGEAVASIACGERVVEVVTPCSGAIRHAQPFEDGAFVEYDQWLVSVTP